MYIDNDSEELLLLLELEKKYFDSVKWNGFFFNLISLMKNLYTITKQY